MRNVNRTLSIQSSNNDAIIIDATGRTAQCSHPIERNGTDVATIFQVERKTIARARIARGAGQWAYAIPLGDTVTIGVIGAPSDELSEELSALLGVAGGAVRVGRRPAFAQRSLQPVGERSIAVGDAALAFSPIAGQGIRFALQSAFAAAAVVKTRARDREARKRVSSYFKELVETAWRRHLEHTRVYSDSDIPATPTRAPSIVRFVAVVREAEVCRDSYIVNEHAVECPSGDLIRWLGDFDLLTMKRLAERPVNVESLASDLEATGLTRSYAVALIQWCVEHGILAESAGSR